jgi:hypothetical protein
MCKSQFILVSSARQTTIVQTVIATQHAAAMTSIDGKGYEVAVLTNFSRNFRLQRYCGTPWYACVGGSGERNETLLGSQNPLFGLSATSVGARATIASHG